MSGAGKAVAKIVEHPRFDRCRFEVVFDPKECQDHPAYQVLSSQPRRLLEVMAQETRRRRSREISGDRLREILEASRREMFPETRQREVFRIFQDYRARFMRAGFIKVLPDRV
jgi:hypothetical protein